MNSVVHFEMPYDDPDRMAKFYQSAFGWETRHLGESMGDYVLATTTESDESGPRRPGAINGGFFPKQTDRPMQVPSIVISVDDIQEAIDRVGRAGGKVLGEPMEIPGIGQYVSFVDSEGNRVSMLEPTPENKARASRAGESESRETRGSRVSAVGTKEQEQQQWSPRQSSSREGSKQELEKSEAGYTEKPGSKSSARSRRGGA